MHIPKIVLILLINNLSLLSMQKESENQIEKLKPPLLIIFCDTEVMINNDPVGYFMTSIWYDKPSGRMINVGDLKTQGRRLYHVEYINEYNNEHSTSTKLNFIKEYKKFLSNKDESAIPIIISKCIFKYSINVSKPIEEWERQEQFCSNCMRRIFAAMKVNEKKQAIIKEENKNTTSYLSLLPQDLLPYFEKFLDDDEIKTWPHLKPLRDYHEQALKELEQEKGDKLKI